MTTRERREARAERLREWADKREEKSDAAHQASHDAVAGIPFGQPILVGHHSERRHRKAIERAQNQATAGLEHSRKADEMRSRAENIEAAAERAIYSDDTDAVERLRERVAALEAEREHVKATNAAYRKAHKDELKALTPYGRDRALPFPSYVLTNLGGNISRQRKRLAQLEREGEHGPRDRFISARFSSRCEDCGAEIERGQQIRYNRSDGARCVSCEVAA